MKKFAKIIMCAAAAAALAASMAAIAACGGGSSVSEYTYKTSFTTSLDEDGNTSVNIIHGTYMGMTIGEGAYMEDTLTLDSSDNTYTLVKYYFAANKDVVLAGVTITDNFYMTYTYYGTYTQDGSSVTLASPSKMDYVESYANNLLASYNGPADLSVTGATNDENDDNAWNINQDNNTDIFVFDTFVGPYIIVTSGGRNASQTVTVSDDGSLAF